MSPTEKTPRDPPADNERPVGKKPWQPPRVRTGHLFESNSLSCGKNTREIEQCGQSPLTS